MESLSAGKPFETGAYILLYKAAFIVPTINVISFHLFLSSSPVVTHSDLRVSWSALCSQCCCRCQIHSRHAGPRLIQTNLFSLHLKNGLPTFIKLLFILFAKVYTCSFCEQWFSSWTLPVVVDLMQCHSQCLINHWNTSFHKYARILLFLWFSKESG